MKCAKLHLQERSKAKEAKSKSTDPAPRRYCQKRLVNPRHEEDPRWIDVFERYHCHDFDKVADDEPIDHDKEGDLFLTVQNLEFNGNVKERVRPRTSFKYRAPLGNDKHRMFVKEVIDDLDQIEMGRVSELTSYYLEDYSKYFQSSWQSRQSSTESSIISNSKVNIKENKNSHDDITLPLGSKKKNKNETRPKKEQNSNLEKDLNGEKENVCNDDTKIAFHKYGKRKSLTISRTDSPATVQVIRVDVVCNYSSNSTSHYEENESDSNDLKLRNEKKGIKSPFNTHKYLLTNTVKKLEENVTGGKVTLLCKTFRLADRCRTVDANSSKQERNTKKFKLQK